MATFTIGATSATFHGLVQGSRQEIGDLQRLTLAIYLDDPAQWGNLESLVTSKYHVHAPLGGSVILDIVRGPGEGALVVDDLGTGTAVMVGLDRGTFLPYDRTKGSATFLVTGGTF